MIPMIATAPPPMRPTVDLIDVRPQAGPQEQFLHTSADIAVYGGAAGAGKSFGLLMEALRHVDNPGFGTVIFRRTSPQIRQEGGLWDTSFGLYRPCGAIPKESTLEWKFPSGSRIRFAHMEGEHDYLNWDGSQIPLIGFDQLESFTWRQFWYMLSRNRTTCGVVPYVRATCNPDPDHWLRSFMSWWIDDASGYPIEERSGIIRWFYTRNDSTTWAGSPEELVAQFGEECLPKSFTFIPGRLEDNPALMRKDPQYRANLDALPRVDRERLRKGNWNIRYTAGMYFQRSWFEIVDAVPELIDVVRYWDRAATDAKTAEKRGKASFTSGAKVGKSARGLYYILDIVRFHGSPLEVESRIKNVASQDGHRVRARFEQDPGQAGKAEAAVHVRNLAGYDAGVNTVRESKGMRAKPLSAQCEAGNVKVLRGPWNEDLLRELENFDGSDQCVSDQTDSLSGGFHCLTALKRAGVWGAAA
jgi:predicted phage terminase large subunit-like protein